MLLSIITTLMATAVMAVISAVAANARRAPVHLLVLDHGLCCQPPKHDFYMLSALRASTVPE